MSEGKCGAVGEMHSWPCENPVHEGQRRCWVHGGRNKAKEQREREMSVTRLTIALHEIAHGDENHARRVAQDALKEFRESSAPATPQEDGP